MHFLQLDKEKLTWFVQGTFKGFTFLTRYKMQNISVAISRSQISIKTELRKYSHQTAGDLCAESAVFSPLA